VTAAGPWLTAALFCERVTSERGHLSALGIFDHRTLAPGQPARLSLLLVTVRGDAAGPYLASIRVHSPAGEPVADLDVTIDPPRQPTATGHVLVPIELVQIQAGVYWFDVHLGGRLAARVPLRLDWA